MIIIDEFILYSGIKTIQYSFILWFNIILRGQTLNYYNNSDNTVQIIKNTS